MASERLFSRSFAAAAMAAAVAVAPVALAGQAQSAKTLYESGKNAELLQAVEQQRESGGAPPESVYLAAQAQIRTGNAEGARNELAYLRDVGDRAWQLIAQAETARVNDDNAAAREAAEQAVEVNPTHPWTHYELGLVASDMNDYQTAAREFERTTQLRPDLAYAHYYAGQAYQRIQQLGKTAEHFQAFLKLAPQAPERVAVQAVLRTLK
ncbi:MAG: tetratricopeptide repeat protein [Vicinamibacterales bacterium]